MREFLLGTGEFTPEEINLLTDEQLESVQAGLPSQELTAGETIAFLWRYRKEIIEAVREILKLFKSDYTNPDLT